MIDFAAAAAQYRIQHYADNKPLMLRSWDQLAPGAQRTWIDLVKPIFAAGLSDEPLYQHEDGFTHTHTCLSRVWPLHLDKECGT